MKRLMIYSPLILAVPVAVLSVEVILRVKELMYWRVR